MQSISSVRKNLDWTRNQIRSIGITATAKKVISTLMDSFYDWRYGTETSKPAWSDSLVTFSQNKVHANCYTPSKARPFTQLLAELKLPTSAVFVDIGAGKGRVLMLAANYRFKQVVGVELCSDLSAQAVRNMEIFRKTRPDLPVIDVVNSDAVEYRIPDGDVVFYLNNSFQTPVLKEFLENVRRAMGSMQRRIWMIYSPPVHDSVVQQSGIFTESRAYEFGGSAFMVYAAGPRRPGG